MCFFEIFLGFHYNLFEFSVAPFSGQQVSTIPSEFQNTVNMNFPANALVFNFFGAGDSLW
jgi:hypothetical protein